MDPDVTYVESKPVVDRFGFVVDAYILEYEKHDKKLSEKQAAKQQNWKEWLSMSSGSIPDLTRKFSTMRLKLKKDRDVPPPPPPSSILPPLGSGAGMTSKTRNRLKKMLRSGIPLEARAEMWRNSPMIARKRQALGYRPARLPLIPTNKVNVNTHPDSKLTASTSGAGAGPGTRINGDLYYHYLLSQLKREAVRKKMVAVDEIERDLDRTFPDHQVFQSSAEGSSTSGGGGKAKLRRVLQAYALRNKKVGYCQSMNVVAGLMILVMDREEDAFFGLCAVVEDTCSEYYSRYLAGSQVDLKVFQTLLDRHVPKISRHFEDLGISLPLLTTRWFMCLFCSVLPTETTMRIWDMIMMMDLIAGDNDDVIGFTTTDSPMPTIPDSSSPYSTIPKRRIRAGSLVSLFSKEASKPTSGPSIPQRLLPGRKNSNPEPPASRGATMGTGGRGNRKANRCRNFLLRIGVAIIVIFQDHLMSLHTLEDVVSSMFEIPKSLHNPSRLFKVYEELEIKDAKFGHDSESDIESIRDRCAEEVEMETDEFRKVRDLRQGALKVKGFSSIELKTFYEQFRQVCGAPNARTSRGSLAFDLAAFERVFQHVLPALVPAAVAGCWTDSDSEGPSPLTRLFKVFDQNGDNMVDFRELLSGLSILAQGNPDETIEMVFKSYDLEDTGYVTKQEMTEMLRSIYRHISDDPLEVVRQPVDQYVDRIFKNLGIHSDRLSLNDFKRAARCEPRLIKCFTLGNHFSATPPPSDQQGFSDDEIDPDPSSSSTPSPVIPASSTTVHPLDNNTTSSSSGNKDTHFILPVMAAMERANSSPDFEIGVVREATELPVEEERLPLGINEDKNTAPLLGRIKRIPMPTWKPIRTDPNDRCCGIL